MKLVKRRAVIVNDVINLVPRSYFETVSYNRLAVKDLGMRLWRNSSGGGRLGSGSFPDSTQTFPYIRFPTNVAPFNIVLYVLQTECLEEATVKRIKFSAILPFWRRK